MASKDELFREALYAFRNISNSGTDSKRYEADAKKYARRIIRAYPTSAEALQARDILRHLDKSIDPMTAPVEQPVQAAEDFVLAHAPETGHTQTTGHTRHTRTRSRAAKTPEARLREIVNDPEWSDLAKRIAALSNNKKNFLVIAAFILFFFMPAGILVLVGAMLFYAFNPALLKKHLDRVLTKLGSR